MRRRTDPPCTESYRCVMLHQFLNANRQELIDRCTHKVTRRLEPMGIAAALDRGVPLFLQQLADTLADEQTTPDRPPVESEPTPAPTAIGRAAALHGAELLRSGYSVDQVVHDYGDVCQAVTALAVEQNYDITTDEFRTLNRCLDNAIADAVASFGTSLQAANDAATASLQDRVGRFSGELRRLVEIIAHAYAAIKTGNVGMNGATGTLLAHALTELQSLVARTLPEIRVADPRAAPLPH